MIILNRFRDSEKDIPQYEQFILTKEDCKELIQDCLKAYEQMKDYSNLTDWLESNKEYTRKEITDYIQAEFNEQLFGIDYSYFGNSYCFTYDILQYADKIIDIDTTQNFNY